MDVSGSYGDNRPRLASATSRQKTQVMMKQEEREFWAKELRSGKYDQGRGKLRRSDNTYCCLGVLCDYLIKETGEGEWRSEDDYNFFHKSGIGAGTFLPQELAEQLEVGYSPKIVTNKSSKAMEEETGVDWNTWNIAANLPPGSYALTALNDKGVPFSIIANLIEKYDVI